MLMPLEDITHLGFGIIARICWILLKRDMETLLRVHIICAND